VASARRYALSRQGSVAFAVLDGSGIYRGLNLSTHYYSASVVKAMLLVEVLRNSGQGHLSDSYRELLGPMIEESNDHDAEEIYNRVGNAGLYAVARTAGMTHFAVDQLFNAQLTADDQARFFIHIDQLVPVVHRSYERRLLSSIVQWQRWGIAPVAEHKGIKVFFKGGWREGIVNQSALLERDGERISLSILTSSDPSMAYGEQTLSGIAERLLG
jgi:hypothetical protein